MIGSTIVMSARLPILSIAFAMFQFEIIKLN